MDQNHARSTTKALRRKRRKLTIGAEISVDFSLEKLNTALLTIKPGKATGLDGLYPEFIKNSGTRRMDCLLFQ
jgi:hypothetical protein